MPTLTRWAVAHLTAVSRRVWEVKSSLHVGSHDASPSPLLRYPHSHFTPSLVPLTYTRRTEILVGDHLRKSYYRPSPITQSQKMTNLNPPSPCVSSKLSPRAVLLLQALQDSNDEVFNAILSTCPADDITELIYYLYACAMRTSDISTELARMDKILQALRAECARDIIVRVVRELLGFLSFLVVVAMAVWWARREAKREKVAPTMGLRLPWDLRAWN